MTVAALLGAVFLWGGSLYLLIRWTLEPVRKQKLAEVIPQDLRPLPPGSLIVGKCYPAPEVEPVTISTGETVARICWACGDQKIERGWR